MKKLWTTYLFAFSLMLMGCREQVHSSVEKNVPEQQVEHPNALSTEIESSLKQDDSIFTIVYSSTRSSMTK